MPTLSRIDISREELDVGRIRGCRGHDSKRSERGQHQLKTPHVG